MGKPRRLMVREQDSDSLAKSGRVVARVASTRLRWRWGPTESAKAPPFLWEEGPGERLAEVKREVVEVSSKAHQTVGGH